MLSQAEAMALKSALEYDHLRYDDFGFDTRKHYKPLEWGEFQASDELNDMFDISKLVADTVTSFDEQKVIILAQGKQGAGKSRFALNLLWNTSMRLAYHRWKDLTRWREIYNYVTNTAIMLKDDCDTLIKNMQKGRCYLLDDVYDALSSDEWYTQIHKAINSIMIADRTDRTVTVITVPRGNWIDRIVRGIAGYRADVKRNLGIKRLGYNQFKFVMLEWNEWDTTKNTPYTPYIKTGNTDWEDGYYSMPPLELDNWYGPMRVLKLELLKIEKRKQPNIEEPEKREHVSDQFYDWLYDSPSLLEKKTNNKFYSGQYLIEEFMKNKNLEIALSTARPIIRRARIEHMR